MHLVPLARLQQFLNFLCEFDVYITTIKKVAVLGPWLQCSGPEHTHINPSMGFHPQAPSKGCWPSNIARPPTSAAGSSWPGGRDDPDVRAEESLEREQHSLVELELRALISDTLQNESISRYLSIS